MQGDETMNDFFNEKGIRCVNGCFHAMQLGECAMCKAKQEEHERIMEDLVSAFLCTSNVPIRKSDLKVFIREQRKHLHPITNKSSKNQDVKE